MCGVNWVDGRDKAEGVSVSSAVCHPARVWWLRMAELGIHLETSCLRLHVVWLDVVAAQWQVPSTNISLTCAVLLLPHIACCVLQLMAQDPERFQDEDEYEEEEGEAAAAGGAANGHAS